MPNFSISQRLAVSILNFELFFETNTTDKSKWRQVNHKLPNFCIMCKIRGRNGVSDATKKPNIARFPVLLILPSVSTLYTLGQTNTT